MSKIVIEIDDLHFRKIIREELEYFFRTSNVEDKDPLLDIKEEYQNNLLKKHGFDKIQKNNIMVNGRIFNLDDLVTREGAMNILGVSNGTFARILKKENVKLKPIVDGFKHYYFKDDLIELKYKVDMKLI